MTAAQLVKTLIVLLGTGPRLFGTEFLARVADNLGNPVGEAQIVAKCDELRPAGSIPGARGNCSRWILTRTVS